LHKDAQDENSPPPDETVDASPTPANADRAEGVAGAEPPLEDEPARIGRRKTSAAGFRSVWETTRRGLKMMGPGRTLRTLSALNQTDGFDCPSCAWPDPDEKRKMAEFCENGAKAVASEATRARVTPDFFAKHSISELQRQSDYWLDQQGRITHPMIRRDGGDHYEPIAWDDAFAMIGSELRGLRSPNEALFYTSGRASNEAAFLYGLLARQLGTNNLPDCSNMCHESSGTGLNATIGIGKATVTIEDFAHADSIFVIGQNPGTNHPRMLTELQ
jgi:anaerobic selenocysteine-containing dehydrogenase